MQMLQTLQTHCLIQRRLWMLTLEVDFAFDLGKCWILYEQTMESRSLVSQKASDSGLHVQLHPLVLLSISDHITRHAAQQKEGPVVGALLGQHNGREITLEHLFECFVITGANGEAQLSNDWFGERLKQCKAKPT